MAGENKTESSEWCPGGSKEGGKSGVSMGGM